MTTPDDNAEQSNHYEWDVPPLKKESDDNDPILTDEKIADAIDILLAPYLPAESELLSDKLFSTNEIIAAIEMHYGVPQGDPSFNTPDAGMRVVKKLNDLGFTYVNRGGLQLEWIMKKKQPL